MPITALLSGLRQNNRDLTHSVSLQGWYECYEQGRSPSTQMAEDAVDTRLYNILHVVPGAPLADLRYDHGCTSLPFPELLVLHILSTHALYFMPYTNCRISSVSIHTQLRKVTYVRYQYFIAYECNHVTPEACVQCGLNMLQYQADI